jgi:hypothetical protein
MMDMLTCFSKTLSARRRGKALRALRRRESIQKVRVIAVSPRLADYGMNTFV